MLSKKTLKLFREYRALKKRKDYFTKEQYVKELQKLLDDVNADITAPKLSDIENRLLIKLLNDKEAN